MHSALENKRLEIMSNISLISLKSHTFVFTDKFLHISVVCCMSFFPVWGLCLQIFLGAGFSLEAQGYASTDLKDFMQSSQKAPPKKQEIGESESMAFTLDGL